MRLVVDVAPGPPTIENVGQAEQSPHQTRLGALDRVPEKGIAGEIEVDDVAEAVDGDAGDVVSDVAVPGNMSPVAALVDVAAIAVRPALLQLFGALGVSSERSVLVAVPEPMDQLHQQIAVDPVPLLNRRMVQLGGLLE